MNETSEVRTRQSAADKAATAQENSIRPAVDVFEDETGITVQADMPGVSRDRLDIEIDGDSLSIIGRIDIPTAENMNAAYADVHLTSYQRSFSLSRELDTDGIDASLKDGVLILRIPKREEHKPRKIEVRTG